MERIAFDIVTPKKGVLFDISNSEIVMCIGIVGIFLALCFMMFFREVYEVNLFEYLVFQFISFLFIVSILIGKFMSFGDYQGNDLTITSVLFFDENEITADYTEVFPLSKITYITFRIIDYKGVRSGRDPKKSLGSNNYIEFQYEQKKHKFQFIIESKGHQQLLIEKLIPQLRTKTKVSY